jgi:hypothetical protein
VQRTTQTIPTAALVLSLLLAGCGSDPIALPAVAGLRLDDAHNALRDQGFEEFSDVDAIEDRQPLLDSNWVVVEQIPAAGERIDADQLVTLRIAKPEDEGIREMLPADSPVLAEIRTKDAERDAAAEEDRREQQEQDRNDAAERARAAQAYAEQIDPAARLAVAAILELRNFRDAVASGNEPYESVAQYVSSFESTMNSYANILDQRDSPEFLKVTVEEAYSAIKYFILAAQTLYSVTGPTSAASIQRFTEVYDLAVRAYNPAISSLYDGTQITPPLV